MVPSMNITEQSPWQSLESQRESLPHLRELFASDPDRASKFQLEAAGLFFDYSKNLITEKTIADLVSLANAAGLRERIDAMFRGDKINITENRAVLHTALRAPRTASIKVDGVDVVPEVHAVLDRMSAFANRIRSGEWKGHTGKPIRNIVKGYMFKTDGTAYSQGFVRRTWRVLQDLNSNPMLR